MTEQRALTIRAGNKLSPIIPSSFEDCQRMAQMAVRAGLFVAKDRPEEARLAYATMAIMQGAEVGMSPMMALQNIAVINGNCRIWGKAVPALIRAAGHKLESRLEGEPFKDDWKSIVTITRGDTGEVIERSFSWAQAKRAKLSSKSGPWQEYPDRMLYWRALGNACTDGTPEVLCGMYIREEAEEDRGEIHEAAPEPPAPPAPPMPPEPPAIIDQTPPEFNVPAFMANLEDELCACQDIEALGESWAHNELTMEDHLDRNQRDAALDIYKKHEARLGGQEAIAEQGAAA